jgi:thymidylate synthase
MHPAYLPYEDRIPDLQYQTVLRSTLSPEHGGVGELYKNQFQTHGRYCNLGMPVIDIRFENGFPLTTERKIGFWRKGINEMAAFMNGARTLTQLREYGDDKTWANYWEQWVTPQKCADFGLETGDLGPGSYSVLGSYPVPGDVSLNQFAAMLEQMRDFPDVTTHMVTSWMPAYVLGNRQRRRKVVVAPCHGNLVRAILLDGKLTLQHVQRSADMPVGSVLNLVGYAHVTMGIARELGVIPHRYVHCFMDAHTYENQVDPWVLELLSREPRPFPTMKIKDTAPRNLLELRAEHYELSDYDPHPAMNDIPVTN